MYIINDNNAAGPSTPPPLPFMRQMKLGTKALLLALQCGLLMIGALVVLLMAYSRDQSSDDVTDEIAAQWGGRVSITGPVAKADPERDNYIKPKTFDCTVNVQSQSLHRNIYQAEVYNAKVTMEGTFTRDVLSKFGDTVYVELAIEPKQIVSLSDLTIGGRELPWETTRRGVMAQVITAGMPDTIRYSTRFDIRGAEDLFIEPTGLLSEVTIEGKAHSPSFQGSVLPTRRTVTDDSFKAVWTTRTRGATVRKTDPTDKPVFEYDTEDTCSVGMEFLTGVDRYTKVTRSLKYSFIIIVLTYLSILCAEVLMKREISLLNYLLIGAALVIFYTLLLSFVEHMPFWAAYLIATLMTVLLITAYMYRLFGARKVALLIGGVISVLYSCCFVLLSLSTYALLMGSVLMFILLAVLMYGSLKLPGLDAR